jgi:amidase
MPVGLTIAGPAYSDTRLVRLGSAVAALGERRTTPPRTPALPDETVFTTARPVGDTALRVSIDTVETEVEGDQTVVRFRASVTGGSARDGAAYVDGVRVETHLDGGLLRGTSRVPTADHATPVSPWTAPYGPLVVVVVRDDAGAVAGDLATTAASPL